MLFTASWCPSCAELDAQVLSGPEGRALLGKGSLEKVDFDAPASRQQVLKSAVTDLPTTVFLGPDGAEIDRIVGFEGKEAFLTEARAILAGRDGLHLLEDQLLRRPEDPGLLFQTGFKLLLRGREKEGLSRYDRILRLDPGNRSGFASKALLHRGRYLVRCKEDPKGAAELLGQAVRRFGTSRDGPALRYWHGWALCKAGRPAEAARALDDWAVEKGRSAQALSLAAELRRRCGHELPRALELAREATGKQPKDDWAWYLVADLAHALGRGAEALEAIGRARAIEPRSAFYEREEARLRKPASGELKTTPPG
jgi:tetratricopeptide (TPR) repeat protein